MKSEPQALEYYKHIFYSIIISFLILQNCNNITPKESFIQMNQNRNNSLQNKILYIVRHAKSDKSETALKDFDRPLTQQGIDDAHTMGKVFVERNIYPDLILSSPAKRAITTAQIIAQEINFPEEKIFTNNEIYENDVKKLVDIIKNIDDSLQKVMIVGHNPSFTALANYLVNQTFEDLPTCAVVGISFDVKRWAIITEKSGKVIFYEQPKK